MEGGGVILSNTEYQYFVPLNMKGCICHFTKWQIHPFMSRGTTYHHTSRLLDPRRRPGRHPWQSLPSRTPCCQEADNQISGLRRTTRIFSALPRSHIEQKLQKQRTKIIENNQIYRDLTRTMFLFESLSLLYVWLCTWVYGYMIEYKLLIDDTW